MKHFKFKTTMKVTGYRGKTLQGVAFTKKRVTANQVAEVINAHIATMAKEGLRKTGEFPESVIDSFKFKTTAESLTLDYVVNLDEPLAGTETINK